LVAPCRVGQHRRLDLPAMHVRFAGPAAGEGCQEPVQDQIRYLLFGQQIQLAQAGDAVLEAEDCGLL
jgi:hypothetical protein